MPEGPMSPPKAKLPPRHTPGPWYVKVVTTAPYTADHKIRPQYILNVVPVTEQEAEANAAIMSAALDLLTALDELASAIADARRRYDAGDTRAIESNAIAATYRQAINVVEKAKGKP